jgi:hypothetical protein
MASLAKRKAAEIDSSEAKTKNSIVTVFPPLNFTGGATEVEYSGGERSLTSSKRSRSMDTKNALDQDVKNSSFWRKFNPSCDQDHNNLMNNTCFVVDFKSIDTSLKSGQSNADESFTFSDEDNISILDDGDWKAEQSERWLMEDADDEAFDFRCSAPPMSHLSKDSALPPRKRRTMNDAYSWKYFLAYLLTDKDIPISVR